MTHWEAKWDARAYDDLSKLDIAQAERIVKKIASYLIRDPRSLGKPLSADLSGLYSYRLGDYRVIYHIESTQKYITIYHIGHRKDVYER